MKQSDRPAQITAILETIGSGDDAAISAELETYIADLEAKQPHRPARIATILSAIGSQYPPNIGISLAVYISDLEAKQQPALPEEKHTPVYDPNNPPVWSQLHIAEREQHRRERARKKKMDYR